MSDPGSPQTEADAGCADADYADQTAADEAAMRAALQVAREAEISGDVPIGCVITDVSGGIIARGVNVREALHDPTGHAEVVALREAGRALGSWRLTGCTMYVTLEPCVMCAAAAVLARVPRLVFGAADDRVGAAGSRFDVVREPLLNHRVEVCGGVLGAECAGLLHRFFAERRG